MKTRYNDFLNENGGGKFYKLLLKYKISTVGKWIYYKNGLGLKNIIYNILNDNYGEPINGDEIKIFESGLTELRKTDYPNIDDVILENLPNGIHNATNVKVNGKWSYVNKLNTNYSDLAELLVDIIGKMMNDKSKSVKEYITPIYENIMNGNVKSGLMMLSSKLKSIIEYYYIEIGNGIDDFLNFTNNIQINTLAGELAEHNVVNFLRDKGFLINHQGGNGDFIDMIFGVDIIVYREDFGYKTVQVKSKEPKKEDVEYYNVDWIAVGGSVVDILDKETFSVVNIKS